MRFAREDRFQVFETHMRQGEELVKGQHWKQARNEFEAALRMYPNHRRAAARLELTKRRLNPSLPGFEVAGDRFDPETGLPLHARVTGFPIEMVLIPGGDTDIGDDRLVGSRPAHTLAVQPFYLTKTELTQRAWTAVASGNPSTHRGDELPVHNVSWTDAQQWIATFNNRVAGGGFRLPTEAEWEKAARAGSIQRAPSVVAWFKENSASRAPAGDFRQIDAYAPHPVGTLEPNTHGVYDLAGNVWEWCSSLLKPYPYNARDGRESRNDAGLRVIRGGGFADPAEYLSPSFRHAERPDRRLLFNGFRLARSVPPALDD
jgi:formylglycine-generating enzyme required for sulfatase activity